MKKDIKYYVAGRMFSDGKGGYRFGLMRPSEAKKPYYTADPGCQTMRLLGSNGSALYLVDEENSTLINVQGPRYGASYSQDDLGYDERCPGRVTDVKIVAELLAAICDGTAYLLG